MSLRLKNGTLLWRSFLHFRALLPKFGTVSICCIRNWEMNSNRPWHGPHYWINSPTVPTQRFFEETFKVLKFQLRNRTPTTLRLIGSIGVKYGVHQALLVPLKSVSQRASYLLKYRC